MIKEFFDELGERYDETQRYAMDIISVGILTEIFKELREKVEPKMLLEIGCSTGLVMRIAKKVGFRCFGVDISRQMLEDAKRKGFDCVLYNGVSLPVKSRKFGVVAICNSIQYFDDLNGILREVHRVLVENGVLLIDEVPNKRFFESLKSVSGDVGEIVKIETGKREKDFMKYKKFVKNEEAIKEILSRNEGFYKEDLVKLLEEAGFRSIEVVYEWIPFMEKVLRDGNVGVWKNISYLLTELRPFSDCIVKYYMVIARK
jgi:ubiquinone/menaquinone biosynthesis C-methylase UbiE